MRKTLIFTLWAILLLGIAGVAIIFTAIAKGKIGYVPPIEELENPNLKFATQIISDDGVTMGTYSLDKDANRIYVGYEELSPHLVKALIATEDERFAEHSGIDARALMRAIVKRGVLQQESAGGGSTITQQLAKQLYTEDLAGSSWERLMQKPIEWVIAVKLERYYTKEEILTMYLNKFDFLYSAHGIKMAANTYFSKEPKDLSILEAATLVGMCKNPSYFNPRRFNERARGRRNVVLGQMLKAGHLTKAQADSLMQEPLELKFRRVDHKEGLATYFREYLRGVLNAKEPVKKNYRGWQMQQYYEDSLAWETDPLYGWCAKNKKKDGTPYNLYTDGLKIYTTIDSRMQRYAEEAVQEHIATAKTGLQDRFFKAKAKKKTAPFTSDLTVEEVNAIMDKAMRLTDRYRGMKKAGATDAEIRKAFNTPQEMTVFTYQGEKDTILTPMDSIRYYKHFLRTGFMSMDPVTGYVKAYVGGTNYNYFQYDMANVGRRQVGSTIKPYVYTLAMENGFSPCDMARHVEQTLIDENGKPWSPRNASKKRYGEMVSAYTAFANRGIRTAPLFVSRIEDNEGNILAEFTPHMEEVISEESVYKMLIMLRAVINEGTGGRIRRVYNIKADMGGKTGTTNNNSDGWFMGFTPSLVSGVWVGGEERDIHFDNMRDGQGAEMALPIWGLYMNKVYADKSLGYLQTDTFAIPHGFDPCKDILADDNAPALQENTGLDNIFQ